jgi:hypothetical protein
MSHLDLTLYMRIGGIVQLGEHGCYDFDCFIMALLPLKRCILQFIPKTGRRVELDDLCIGVIS